jgi:hypothetical protein
MLGLDFNWIYLAEPRGYHRVKLFELLKDDTMEKMRRDAELVFYQIQAAF